MVPGRGREFKGPRIETNTTSEFGLTWEDGFLLLSNFGTGGPSSIDPAREIASKDCQQLEARSTSSAPFWGRRRVDTTRTCRAISGPARKSSPAEGLRCLPALLEMSPFDPKAHTEN